jgi:hypothetical protein
MEYALIATAAASCLACWQVDVEDTSKVYSLSVSVAASHGMF